MLPPRSAIRALLGFLRGRRGKRVVVLIGAGASVEYKAPSTWSLTEAIAREVNSDPLMAHTGAAVAFTKIKTGLETYLNEVPNFEQIYHCAHELLAIKPPTVGAVDEYRPLLYPFLSDLVGANGDALEALIDKMARVIYAEVSCACDSNPLSLDPLRRFVADLRAAYTTRIYTTNYDDFVLQADPNLYTGFDPRPSATPKRFQLDRFWDAADRDAILYLHGSIHMGFATPGPSSEIGELSWFDDRSEALRHSSFHGSGVRQMDGTEFVRTAVITGLDKLSRLQQRPLSHFYSALSLDLMKADLIIVAGSGLADLHLNTWLKEARSRTPNPPILFVDFWKDGFFKTRFDFGRKEIEMFHALGIHMHDHGDAVSLGTGWTVAKDKSAAVWDKGFQAFLAAPAELRSVLRSLGVSHFGM